MKTTFFIHDDTGEKNKNNKKKKQTTFDGTKGLRL